MKFQWVFEILQIFIFFAYYWSLSDVIDMYHNKELQTILGKPDIILNRVNWIRSLKVFTSLFLYSKNLTSAAEGNCASLHAEWRLGLHILDSLAPLFALFGGVWFRTYRGKERNIQYIPRVWNRREIHLTRPALPYALQTVLQLYKKYSE